MSSLKFRDLIIKETYNGFTVQVTSEGWSSANSECFVFQCAVSLRQFVQDFYNDKAFYYDKHQANIK